MTGQYAHTIDAKGRLFIPAALRKELGQTFHPHNSPLTRLVYIIPGKIARENYVYRHGKSQIFRRFSAKFFHFLKRLFDEHKRKTPAGTRFCARRSLLTQDETFLWKSQKNLRGFYRFSTKSITAAGRDRPRFPSEKTDRRRQSLRRST